MHSKSIEVGDKFPDFSLPTTIDKEITNTDFTNDFTVIFIYPKDNTSSCTQEALDFSNNFKIFKSLNTDIFGLSKDNLSSHKKFIEKHNLKIPLISDEELKLIKLLNSWVEKHMYGKAYYGTERSTFLISKDQTIVKIWRKVKVKNHVVDVIEAVKKFN